MVKDRVLYPVDTSPLKEILELVLELESKGYEIDYSLDSNIGYIKWSKN